MLGVMWLEDLIGGLGEAVESLDPDCFSGSDAARLVVLFDRGEKLCATGRALMARRAAECNEWSKTGARSAADWLAMLSGTSHSDAQGVLDSAETAAGQPALDEAMRSGDLSSDQAREISDAAKHDSSATARLVKAAKKRSLAGLRKECRQVKTTSKRREDDEAKAKRLRDGRYLRLWSDPEGAGRIDGRLDPLAFAEFQARLAPFEKYIFDQARAHAQREPFDAYRADALLLMAQTATTHTAAGTTDAGVDDQADHDDLSVGSPGPGDPDADPSGPGDPDADSTGSGDPPGGSPPGGFPRPVPAEMIIVVDWTALIRGYTRGAEACYIDGFGPIPVALARQMLDDAFLAAVLKDGTDIRRVVHLGRYPTRMQKTALRIRDPQCVVPGCESTRRLEYDHVPDWNITHHTTLDELARECSFHHDQRTYYGATLSGGPGDWQWTPPPPGPFDDPPGPGPFDDPPAGQHNPGPFDDPPCAADLGTETPRPQPELFDTG
jgi:hypothetical protein